MGFPIYDSYDPFYKSAFGALRAGDAVRLRLRVPRHMGVERPVLLLLADGEEQPECRPLAWESSFEGDDLFALELTVEEPGLYFYWFDLYRDYQKIWKGQQGECTVSAEQGTPYQLTVYARDFTVNEALTGGVRYQIFPDRFFEGQPGKNMPFADRIYRTDKTGQPYYWPTETPEGYLNRDYFGGDLAGIREKLPYLQGLGVTCIYLNPIFEAHSNHRYNTADYLRVDPVLGTNEDFTALCDAAHARGIRVLLDGVFSHTGSDSRYFNREGRYPGVGAWQSESSPYRSWYVFGEGYTGGYRSWWGFETLPEVNEDDPGYRAFICGENGVLRTWLRRGADGWRLDVADELPDGFIAAIRRAVKAEGAEKLLLGEVWEDASTKISYGSRRKFLWGGELDTVMNYPWRTAILDFVRYGDGAACGRTLLELCDHYPPAALHTLMNSLGTHDTERAVTALAGESGEGRDRTWQSRRRLSPEQRAVGLRQLRLATMLQFFLPGVPCIYYGDEIGMGGYRDPFNRGYFDWDDDTQLIRQTVRQMAALRRDHPALHTGSLRVAAADADTLMLERRLGGDRVVLLVNRSRYHAAERALPWGGVLHAEPLHGALAVCDGA